MNKGGLLKHGQFQDFLYRPGCIMDCLDVMNYSRDAVQFYFANHIGLEAPEEMLRARFFLRQFPAWVPYSALPRVAPPAPAWFLAPAPPPPVNVSVNLPSLVAAPAPIPSPAPVIVQAPAPVFIPPAQAQQQRPRRNMPQQLPWSELERLVQRRSKRLKRSGPQTKNDK